MMNNSVNIFLTPAQATNAIEKDFIQYAPQFDLFQKLCPLLTDNRKLVIKESRDSCLLITCGKKSKERRLTDRELGQFLFSRLKHNTYPLSAMAEICSIVFQTRAWAGREKESGAGGIWLETEMAQFKCRQCGNCCRHLSYHNDCTENDYKRWQAAGREDILKKVLITHAPGSQSPVYKIWKQPGTRHYYEQCPWLFFDTSTGRHICQIQDVKPEYCRQYPLTRKHALMTGCKGIFDDKT